MDKRDRFKAILSTKDTWLFALAVALIAMVWSANITPLSGNIALVLAVAFSGAAVYFNHRLSDDSHVTRIAWTLLVSGAAGAFCSFVLWTPLSPAPELDSGSLALKYRVRGVEKRTWKVGTVDEYKSLVAEMEIVNCSADAMSLEFMLVMHFSDTTTEDYPVSFELAWIDHLDGSLIMEPEAEKTEVEHHNYVNVPPNSSVTGHVLCEFPKKTADGRPEVPWDKLPYDRIEFKFVDRATAKTLTAQFRAHPSETARPFIELDFPENLQPIFNEDGTPRYGPVVAHVIGVDDAHPLSASEKQRYLKDRANFTITKQNELEAVEAAKKLENPPKHQ
jgi:hypothetical protein